MSILSSLFEKITKEQEQKQSAKSKLMDFEKMIADQARSQGMLPRTYLEQLCQQSESFANSKLVKVLLGERDVPTQKGRDAKPEVLTKRAMNVVKKGIKQAANKQRRRDDKDAVDEQGFVKGMKMPRPGDNISTQDKMKMLQAIKQKRIQHAKMAPGLAKDKLSGEILDMMANAKVLLQSMHEDVEQDTQYAKMIIQQNPQEYKKFMQTGDLMDAPTVYEKLFAYFSSSDADDQMPYGTQKARDGDPYVWITDKLDDLGLTEGNEFAQKVRQLKAQGAKKGTKFKTSDGQEHTLEQIIEKTRQYLDMLEQRLKEQNMSEEHEDKGEIQFGSYQTKHFDMCPTATDLYKDGKFKDMDLAERSVKLQDILFYMEKHAMEMKKVDEQYVMMMQNLADQIMAMAKMMDMEEEHNYIQSHVDAVKNMDESIGESKAITEEEFDQLAEKKDACYHKVKARYKVWPSAYASGALVQCRKKGAANWGNKSKK